MRRYRVFILVVLFLLSGTLIRSSFADDGSGLVSVQVEIPEDLKELPEEKVRSVLREFIPPSFSISDVREDELILRGARGCVTDLEKNGLGIEKVISVSSPRKGTSKQASSSILYFSSLSPWTPMIFSGELIDEVLENDLDGDGESEIIVRTNNATETQGKIYVYSRQGTLLGSWTSATNGTDNVNIYDLDNDGTDEIVVELVYFNTFYVLSHTAAVEWSGTVTDSIYTISCRDLYDNDKREVIVFSRNTSIPRGAITVFDPDTQTATGSRQYTAADLSGTRSPYSAYYRDLDGDGTEEIIPYADGYLKQKIEVLSHNCSLLTTESLSMDPEVMNTSHDFNGDNRDDIAVLSSDGTNIKLYGFIDFNGSGFNSSWTYPTGAGVIGKEDAYWDMDDSRIAFATEDEDNFSGCYVYLLNAANGTEVVSPVSFIGSADGLEYEDLNNNGNKEVALLANIYSDPTHVWTFYVYGSSLNLLVPVGHFSYSLATGSKSSSSYFDNNDFTGDNTKELIPYRYTGNKVYLVRYTGVLGWEYDAGDEVEDIDYYDDLNGDGNDDLLVAAGSIGGGGCLTGLSDQGASYGVIGQRTFVGDIGSVSAHDFNNDGYEEIWPGFRYSDEVRIFPYDLGSQFWSFTPGGDDLEEVDYMYDLDGNGVDDFLIASNNTLSTTGYLYIFLGGSYLGEQVVDSGDYNGDGTSDIAIFRGSSGMWSVRGVTRVYYGSDSDIPVPGDYNGDGATDIGIFRPGSGLWGVRGVTRAYYGTASDKPVPGDYDGDGSCDIGIFRSSSGLWAVTGVTRVYFGGSSDIPVPGDYDGDGRKGIAVFRGSSGMWASPGYPRVYFGSSSDTVVPGDYNGDGTWEPAIFRPSAGMWAVTGVTRVYYGSSSDQPVPADYNGDSADDVGIFRGSSGLWGIRGISRAYFGSSGDIPVTR